MRGKEKQENAYIDKGAQDQSKKREEEESYC